MSCRASEVRRAVQATCVALLAAAGLFLVGAMGLTQGPPSPRAGEVRVNPKDGAEMVYIPAGEFLMGSTDEEIAALVKARTTWKKEWFDHEKPRHKVALDGYWIYKHEVTVAQYRAFCRATGRKMPALPEWSRDNHPMVNVSWDDAAAYCAWAGVRLPTEAEWEMAACGTENRRFPWGNDWDPRKCNGYEGGPKRTAPVGSFPKSATPYGVQDMAGNAWEWCQDWYDERYYAKSPVKNPQGPATGDMRVMRGGSWGSSSASMRAASRHADAPDLPYHDCGGFRCAKSGA